MPELLNFMEDNLLHFRDYLPTNAPLRILSRPQVHKTQSRRPPELPQARLEESDSDIDELPLSRGELRMAVDRTLAQKKMKAKRL